MSITVFVLPFIIFGLLVLLATAPIVTSGKDRDCPLFTKGFIDFLTGDDTPGKLFTLNFTTGMEARFGLQGWLGGADDDDGNCDCNEQDKANSGNRQCNAPGAIRYPL
jgi:hypothetical protein